MTEDRPILSSWWPGSRDEGAQIKVKYVSNGFFGPLSRPLAPPRRAAGEAAAGRGVLGWLLALGGGGLCLRPLSPSGDSFGPPLRPPPRPEKRRAR